MKVLKKINNKARLKTQRQHVTKYIWDHKNQFKILSLPATKESLSPLKV